MFTTRIWVGNLGWLHSRFLERYVGPKSYSSYHAHPFQKHTDIAVSPSKQVKKWKATFIKVDREDGNEGDKRQSIVAAFDKSI